MQKRRAFIKTITSGLAGSFTFSELHAGHVFPATKLSGNGEDFWKQLRKAFPLQEGKTYFNNGTFGPPSFPVLKIMEEKMTYMATTGDYGDINPFREVFARFLKVTKEEIAFTHNTTEGINIAAWAIPLKAGDEVILTLQEHVGNALPWLNLARQKGIVPRPFEPASTMKQVLAQVESLLNERTRVIAIPHATCTTGQVLPIEEICRMAMSRNIFTAIDGAHGAGAIDLDLKKIGCDFYAGSCHKWLLGPAGTGFLYVKSTLIEKIEPLFVGAHSDQGWWMEEKSYGIKAFASSAHRFDYGIQNSALFAAAAEAIRFMEGIGMAKVSARVCELSSYLYNALTGLSLKLQMLTPAEAGSRMGMVSFRPLTMDYISFNNAALKQGFRLRVVPESNLNAIRVSTHIYNSKEEIDRFVNFSKGIL